MGCLIIVALIPNKKARPVAYVVTENCINCKHTTCVEVCPCDCFHEGPNFLVIDPEACVDCDLCVAECPVGAIYAEEDVPADQLHFINLNAELAKKWPNITERKSPPEDADKWDGYPSKISLLIDEA